MNLQELNSALPKDWLSVKAHEVKCDILNSSISYSGGPVSTTSGTGTLDITAANLVEGVIGATGAGTLTIQLPTSTAINDYLNSISSGVTRFKFTACASAAPGPVSAISVLMGSGITTFNGGTLTVATGIQKDLIFSKSGSNWVVYF